MQLLTVLEKAAAETATIVRGVKPDQLDDPSPCRDWDVRTLTNHLVQVASALSLAGRREPVPDDLWGREFPADHRAERFADETRAAATAWAAPGAWDGAVRMGSAEMPAAMVATMLVADLTVHGWDLAGATGQEYGCDDDVAELAYRFIADSADQGRQMGIFAEPVPVAEGASTLHRALALSGRDPRWQPTPR